MSPITFRLSKSDYAACNEHISENLRSNSPAYAAVYVLMLLSLICALIGFGGLLSYASTLKPGKYWPFAINAVLLLVSTALFFLMGFVAKLSASALLFRSGSKLLSTVQFCPGATSIVVKTVEGQTETKWNAIEKMGIHGPHLYLFTMPNFALIVPQSAFSSREEFEKYAHGLRAMWQNAA